MLCRIERKTKIRGGSAIRHRYDDRDLLTGSVHVNFIIICRLRIPQSVAKHK